MNWSDTTSSGRPVDELIEPYLDGALSPDDRQRVLTAAAEDREFARQLAVARSIREALHSMPSVVAPPDLVPSVMRVARKDRRKQLLASIEERFRSITTSGLRPALATATLVAVIVAAGLFGRPAQPTVSPEAQAALDQIKWTLALVSEVTERSTTHIRRDVLEPHVVGHMQTVAHDVFEDPRAGSKLN
ncbi:MAG: hypothetical protein HKN29_15380 [Rhodothermales bacterium]|nr:hypothetical protein [Rhodothermales bacterium]